MSVRNSFALGIICTIILHISGAVNSLLLEPQPDKLSEDGRLTFPGIAAKYGFPAEQENVITEDGYILSLFHIPGNVSSPVLLIHGNILTADSWIERGNISLAITLARRGFDVWAINLRGSRYSRKHITLDPDTQPSQFFDFSFYEQAIYDIPSTIDFILEKTGQAKLMAIGHSLGTTMLYVLGAELPEYNDKIKIGISLAPISFIQNLRGVATVGVALGPLLVDGLKLLNIYEVENYNQTAPLFQAICLIPGGYTLCIKIGLFSLVGEDTDGFEPEFQKTIYGHFPGGTSLKVFDHLIQVARSKKFARYDYGFLENLKVYKRLNPPEFDLKKVRMKSALFVGEQDFLGTVEDAELLRASLPNVVHYQVLPYKKFNHVDFFWGRYMTENFYPYLLEVIDKYN
ncbi:lipase 1-like [Ostrinia furnacalis]|uniref:lipase 1-like n=1 Tax=Ostrinia furnacalis TaxID=93504 RepID=UPI0010386B6D|nr:lipase 1-like [Ostrinia furnacalis]